MKDSWTGSWRIDVLQLHLVDADTHGVFGRERLHLGERFRFDLLATDSDHLVYRAIADDFTHYGLGDIAQRGTRLPHLEQIFHRIGDAVLHHPLDEGGVQIAGDHFCFAFTVARTLIRIGRSRCGESELLLQLALHGNNGCQVDTQGQFEMQPGLNFFEVFAKTLHHRDRIAGHSVVRRPQAYTHENDAPRRMTPRGPPPENACLMRSPA